MLREDRKEKNSLQHKYILSHLTLLDCTTPELVYIASRAGYDAICPRLIPLGVAGECPFSLLDRNMIKATLTALRVTGIKVHAIELVKITDPCDVKAFEEAIERGAELGAGYLIASAWTTSDNDHNYLADKYAEICDLADSYGMSVALEFPSFSRLNDLRQAADIVRAANRPNGGILVDVLYMHMSQINPAELVGLPAEWFNHIHVCDVLQDMPYTREKMISIARNLRLYPGEGCIDFKSIIESLPPVDYCIEIPNRKRIDALGYEEYARRCLQSARDTLETVNSKRIPGDSKI